MRPLPGLPSTLSGARRKQLAVVVVASLVVLGLLVVGSARPMSSFGARAAGSGGALEEEDPVASTDFGEPPEESEQSEEEPDPDEEPLYPLPPRGGGGTTAKTPSPTYPPVVFDNTNPVAPKFRRNAGVHLITTFFVGTYHRKRVNELLETLKRNVENPHFEAVHVLWEDANPRLNFSDPASHFYIDPTTLEKLVTIKVMKQPTYRKYFDYANLYLKRGSIVITSNSDIYFDASIRRLVFGVPKGVSNNTSSSQPATKWRSAMALSRRHAPECGQKNDWKSTFDLCDHYIGSHDAFVFAPPVPEFVRKNSVHSQNHFGAENIIVWAFLWAKDYRGRVLNPCQRIRGFHLHCSPERHYEIGKFISRGRHGNVEPGVQPYQENTWMYIH